MIGETIRLGEMCEILDTLRKPITKKFRKHGQYPYYGATGIVDYVNDYIFDETLVLIGEDGAKWDKGDQTAFIVSGKYWVNNHAHVIRPFKDKLDQKFLVYYLNSIDLKPWVTGLTVPKLNQEKLKSIPIPLLAIEEQKNIVTKLDEAFIEIDKMISLKKKSILNLDNFFLNRLNSFFLDNSNNWENTTLGTYYDVRDGTHDSPKYVPQGIPLVTSKNLKNGKINLTKIKYIKNEDYLLIKKRSGVSIGDVLMAMIGTIGNPVIIKNDNKFAIKNVALFKVKENQSSDFLKYYLDSNFVINKMMNDAKGTTQQFVGLGYLRSFPIKIPSFKQQQQISLKIISLENNFDALKKEYNSILKNYISLKNSFLIELLNKDKAA